jgi:hypothetical protein
VGGEGQHNAVFDQVDAPGVDLTVHPSAEAERYGWADAFAPDPLVCTVSPYGRGDRDSPSEIQGSVPFLLINKTPPRESSEETTA